MSNPVSDLRQKVKKLESRVRQLTGGSNQDHVSQLVGDSTDAPVRSGFSAACAQSKRDVVDGVEKKAQASLAANPRSCWHRCRAGLGLSPAEPWTEAASVSTKRSRSTRTLRGCSEYHTP
jgi:hypothetical protein